MSVLTGYLVKGTLKTWKGKETGWRWHRTVATYTIAPDYDRTQAVILKKHGKKGDFWAAGYFLNDAGDLFRGETMGSAPHGSRKEADLVEDAEREAENLAEYWGQKDQEAREEDDAAMLEDQESYE